MAKSLMKKYYMSRERGGLEQCYSSPEQFLKKAYEYFEWCDSTPWSKSELLKSGDRKGNLADVPIGRPYTLVGLCVYCGVSDDTILLYEADEAFAPVVKHITDIIRQHQLEGASLGVYNPSVVHRMQGVEKLGVGDAQKSPIVINVTTQETESAIDELKKKLE